MNFSIRKSQKGGFLPASDDAALRPRGRAAGGPREAQEAHRAQTRGKRPRVSTRPRGRLCGAPRGR